MNNVHGIIYAYHSFPELKTLGAHRTGAALPFCGRYRLIDVALSGHTLGGLIKLGGYEVFSPLASDKKYSSGWQIESGTKILISEGLSGGFLPLRLGTSAQVHVITLRRQTD